MSSRFYIEDELHAEPFSEHSTYQEAIEKLIKLSKIPWNKHPNRAPCQGWRTCGRHYEIVEYDPLKPDDEISRTLVLEISADSVIWRQDVSTD